jgi:hypothetical protein
MTQKNLEEILRRDKEALAKENSPPETLYLEFQKRLAASPAMAPQPEIRSRLAWWVPALAVALLVIAFSWVATSRANKPSLDGPRQITKTRVEIRDLEPLTVYRFQRTVQIETALSNALSIEAGAVARLVSSDPSGNRWELREGTLRVSNQTALRYANVIQAAGHTLREIGTAFDVACHDGSLDLRVHEGAVEITRDRDGQRTIVSRGASWSLQAPLPAPETPGRPVPQNAPKGLARGALIDGTGVVSETPTAIHLLRGDSWLRYDRGDDGGLFQPVFERRIQPPPDPWFIAPAGAALAVATHTEYLYFFDATGSRTGVRVGVLSCRQVFFGGGKTWVVNAAGELFEIDRNFRIVRKEKILTASLWEGLLVDGPRPVLVLPDVEARIVFVDLNSGTHRVRALPTVAKASPRPAAGGVFIPGPDLVIDPGP